MLNKIILFVFIMLCSETGISQSDSLSYYKDKTLELKKQQEALISEMEKRDEIANSEKERLQSLLIYACIASLGVVGFSFYVLMKKKKDK